MGDIWVISDTHFGHDNIIKYCNRPFSDAKEMDEALVENWNKTVKDGDIVYHLGDVYFGERGRSVLLSERLKGRKRLILGNHDNGKDQTLHHYFQKIEVWRHFKEFGLLLTHVPVHPESLNDKVPKNVHGHIHDRYVLSSPHHHDLRYHNVSVEAINYTPINIEELRVK